MRVDRRYREGIYIVSQAYMQTLQYPAESGLADPCGKFLAHCLQRAVGIHPLAGNITGTRNGGGYQSGNTGYEENFHMAILQTNSGHAASPIVGVYSDRCYLHAYHKEMTAGVP